MAKATKKAPAKKSAAKKPARKTAAKKPAAKKTAARKPAKSVSGYGAGSVDVVMSVEAVAREAARISDGAPKPEVLAAMVGGEPYVSIEGLNAGYGRMEILHDFDLRVGRGQSLCLIGPNGAGKSTVLHSIFGFTNIFGGRINVGGKDVTALKPNDKLKTAGIAYILQDNSVFPDMTV
ncbi:MAG: ATP-binding cassette domain-containing protein, partial [Hyphomicrobiales bacterium]|nr:ATP-binding cassette domain-containing protein [Hyphomicrobiales bacterium]